MILSIFSKQKWCCVWLLCAVGSLYGCSTQEAQKTLEGSPMASSITFPQDFIEKVKSLNANQEFFFQGNHFSLHHSYEAASGYHCKVLDVWDEDHKYLSQKIICFSEKEAIEARNILPEMR